MGHFDLHQHYGALIGVQSAGRSAALTPEQDCAGRLAFMDRFGISRAAMMPAHSYSAPNGFSDIHAMNDGLHAYGRLAPERIAALFGTVDPRHGAMSVDEVDRLASLGFKGLSWHHRFQGLPMDHPVMIAIAERMDSHRMIALMHCYANGDFESVWRLRRLAERFTEIRFVALDAMTSPENVEQIFALIDVCPNVYIDLTSTLLGPRGVQWAVERIGAKRVTFGSNCYSGSSPHSIAALDAVERALLSSADKQAILADNAASLLGIRV